MGQSFKCTLYRFFVLIFQLFSVDAPVVLDTIRLETRWDSFYAAPTDDLFVMERSSMVS